MTSKDLMRLLKKDGWYLDRVVGSHHHFKHPFKKGLVTVVHPKKDMKIKTIQSALKQAGLK